MNTDILSPATVRELKALWKEVFCDTDEVIDAFFDTAYSPGRCRVLIREGELCSALYILDCTLKGEKIAYIYAAASAKAHRNRGYFKALLEDTHAFLKSAGYAGVLLVPAGKELFRFYERFGYEVCSYADELCAEASNESTPLKEVTPEEYVRLIGRYAGEEHVFFTLPAVKYLGRIEKLYAGDGFLFSARVCDGVLRVSEFFGDTSAAGHIVKALGCERGVFRLDGSAKPFAMYLSLKESKRVPRVSFTAALD